MRSTTIRKSPLYKFIQEEENRQKSNLELIASENFISSEVRNLCASVLTHKYAEGYPGKRYYGGCQYIDEVERYTQDLAKKLFHAEYANVQPHSGSNANLAVLHAFLQANDVILGMDLSHGGHLTHGAAVSFSGKFYDAHFYGVDKKTEYLDYDIIRNIAKKVRPKIIIAGASSYPRIIDFASFRDIADEVGALLFVDMAHIAGLVAVGLHPSPLPHAHVVSTTTHKTLRGPRGGMILVGKDMPNIFNITTKSGRIKNISELLNNSVIPGVQGGPLMHIIAAKGKSFEEALQDSFVTYQQNVLRNSKRLAKALHEKHGVRIITGGTDNHIVLADISDFGITGKKAEILLDQAGLTVNKNMIPFDKQGPLVTSGIRLGTPAVTTRGMKEEDMDFIADCIGRILCEKEKAVKDVAEEVFQFVQRYPLFYSDEVVR